MHLDAVDVIGPKVQANSSRVRALPMRASLAWAAVASVRHS